MKDVYVDGMCWIGDISDISGNGWISESELREWVEVLKMSEGVEDAATLWLLMDRFGVLLGLM